jgi:hypothetical protein
MMGLCHVVHSPGDRVNLGIGLLPLKIFFIEILLLINWLTWWLYFIKDSFWCSIHFGINLMFHFQIFATKKNIGWELSCLSQVLQFPCCQAFHVLCYYYTCFEYRCRSLHSYNILGAGMLWKPKEARILTNFINPPVNIGKHSCTKNVLTRCFTKNFHEF